jgi:hypothetical protein
MRNDARPIGEHAPASPVGGDNDREESPLPSERSDSRDTVAHGRESHIINQPAEAREPDAPDDPTMPQNDATLNTKI